MVCLNTVKCVFFCMDDKASFRDTALEHRLQNTLDEGHRVWVVGDVHGFHLTLEALLEQLTLSAEDMVVFLGDLIDRGPGSYQVVQTVMNHPQCVSVLGNHEAMMLEQFTEERLARHDQEVVAWWHNGGSSTVYSYEQAHTDGANELDERAMYAAVEKHQDWLSTLPLHIVLDRWRLVHAGYDPTMVLDEQSEGEYLWIRRPFHEATAPVDPQRTVVFGHTPTTALPGPSRVEWGTIWRSAVLLDDGRSASIGIDTCLFHRQPGAKHLTAYDLQTGDVVHQARLEP